VNAAFLLVTSAMLVGQAGGDKKPAPAAPAPAPAPVVSTGCGPSCGSCQDACGCDSFGHKLREKLKGLFARKCDTCKPAHTPIFHKSCDTCDSCPKVWTWQKRCHEPACTSCAPKTCDTCTSSCGCGSHAFLERLREGFRRKGCCETCSTCSTCGSAPPVTAPPAKMPEKIEPPKKMPDPKAAPDKKPAQVRIDAPAAIPAIPTTPTVEVAPSPASTVPVPRVEGDRRDPF